MPEEFEKTALFLWLGVASTLIRHENRSFRKSSPNFVNLKTRAWAQTEIFDRNNDVTTVTWFPFPRRPQTTCDCVINLFGVMWKRPKSNSLQYSVCFKSLVRERRTDQHDTSVGLSMSSCSTMDRAPAWCSGGHGFDSPCRLDFLPLFRK